MPIKTRDVVKALEKKGFKKKNSKDVRYIYFRLNGKKSVISTMLSHGENEISDSLLSRMSAQMNITRGKFDEFVECSLTQPDYEKLAVGPYPGTLSP